MMNTPLAVKPEVPPVAGAAPVASRRFELPDIDRHGLWLLPRLRQTYPHLNDRSILGWLRTILYSNDFLFLYQENAVALAQVMSAHTLAPKPVVEERFVWVKDPQDKEQLAAAACFYTDMERWAKHHGAETLIVEEQSDVPHEAVREKLGRIFTTQRQFAKVREKVE